MSNFNVNIDTSSVEKLFETTAQTKSNQTVFDPKNYLDTRLADNETSKTLTIRLLPISKEGGLPFEKVHMHTLKVRKEIAPSGWKTFVCPVHNHMGDKCPFCEISEEARKMRFSTHSEQEKQKYKELENMNRAKEMWVARCIERGHESDGIKFWLLPNSKDGAFAKIMGVWKTRMDRAKAKGQENNIFDLSNGKDLDITISRSSDGKNVISVVDADEKTPLTDDYELGMKWINDPKKWTDVYKVKPYDYMYVVASGGVPMYSREQGKYIDREDAMKASEEATQSQLMEQKVDYTMMPTEAQVKSNNIVLNQASSVSNNNDDDIPF